MTISNITRLVFASLTVVTVGLAQMAPAVAGPGHGHSHSHATLTKEEILPAGVGVKENLIRSGKIAASWSAVAPEDAVQVDNKGQKEWLVTFKDAAATDKAKERLYIFFTLNGNFIAANFTGK